jgi:hypothetical protein
LIANALTRRIYTTPLDRIEEGEKVMVAEVAYEAQNSLMDNPAFTDFFI